MGLHDRANMLRNLVSPSTGLGLSDIWSTFYMEKNSENVYESVKRTESRSRSLKTSPTSSSTSFYSEFIRFLTVYKVFAVKHLMLCVWKCYQSRWYLKTLLLYQI